MMNNRARAGVGAGASLFRGVLPLALVAAALCSASAWGAERVSSDNVWAALDKLPVSRNATAQTYIAPQKFQAVRLDETALLNKLAEAPMEFSDAANRSRPVIQLPMPDGTFASFDFVESPIMEPELAREWYWIQTFSGQGIDDPAATVRFDWTAKGLRAQVLSPNGAFYIDPAYTDDTELYASYYKRDYLPPADKVFRCGVGDPEFEMAAPVADSSDWQAFDDLNGGEGGTKTAPFEAGEPFDPGSDEATSANARAAITLRTYRIAVACTGEYAQFHGGTVAGVSSAIATTINRVTGIYEKELAIRMVLVANNNSLIYLNGSTDPFNNTNAGTLINQSQSVINSAIGNSNYDIGHTVSTGGGGLAGLGVVCRTGQKARGITGSSSPVGDPYDVDYVAHEVGHQFSGNHTWNGNGGSCSAGNNNSSTAYEPGSGSTIQAYAGICGSSNNLQNNSDPYFHHESLREMSNYTRSGSGNGCPATTSTGNSDPSANAGSNYTIPKQTMFRLKGSGSDPNGDSLTYCWEERDLGPQQIPSSDNGSSPLWRSWNPTANNYRWFPREQDVLDGSLVIGERLPTQSRSMKFRLVVRDNKAGGGGFGTDDVTITVSSSGPFQVTSPNGGESWTGGNMETVTWNTGGSTSYAPNVDIMLVTGGNLEGATMLLANTPNDGSQAITVPSMNTSTARIMVREENSNDGHFFFDISNANFTIGEGMGGGGDDPGDTCADPLPGPAVNATIVADSSGGRPNTVGASCAGGSPNGPEVYYDLGTLQPGDYTLTTSSGGGSPLTDTVLTLLGGCPGPELGCNDDIVSGNLFSEIQFTVTTAGPYLVVFQGYSGEGTANLTLTKEASPGEDCASPDAGPAVGSPVTVDTTGHANTTGEACAGAGPLHGADGWYELQPSPLPAGDYTLTTSSGGSAAMTDTVIGLYTSCGGAPVGCNDDASGLFSEIQFTANGTDAYIVHLEAYGENVAGSAILTLESSAGAPDIELDPLSLVVPEP